MLNLPRPIAQSVKTKKNPQKTFKQKNKLFCFFFKILKLNFFSIK